MGLGIPCGFAAWGKRWGQSKLSSPRLRGVDVWILTLLIGIADTGFLVVGRALYWR